MSINNYRPKQRVNVKSLPGREEFLQKLKDKFAKRIKDTRNEQIAKFRQENLGLVNKAIDYEYTFDDVFKELEGDYMEVDNSFGSSNSSNSGVDDDNIYTDDDRYLYSFYKLTKEDEQKIIDDIQSTYETISNEDKTNQDLFKEIDNDDELEYQIKEFNRLNSKGII
ncbi:WD40 repeat-containing protein [Tieghemostelium lacteum]|uniref:WD40 repeat-containing protein n=1 Tax=Tieghemostelium lacteum TaxID=361077 RepID=A0A151ZE24_TIELA|nr:WD40 repeat-containing protein [Tieghemostelium lacteum]|eukprot:KYQ92206.1 WD40 repeat-containing protein [Tieghemostelium lacteum]